MIKVGIIGGAGYTAGELIRLLVNHPHVEIKFVHSSSNAGRKVTEVHSGLYGDTELEFCSEFSSGDIDVLFLCLAHGDSKRFLESHIIPSSVKIIDLAQDYRDESENFVYGLPELKLETIVTASRVANPGCFATAIQLALLPAVASGIIEGDVNVTALTGSTGAGVKPSATTHFSYRNNNISTYKEFSHQHLKEIDRNLGAISPDGLAPRICFVPMRGDFSRGIFASVHFKTPVSQQQAVDIYKTFYRDAEFTHYVDFPIDLKQVVNTNKALVHADLHEGYLHVTCVIDNLLKGASGQAVQNMNIIFGLPQSEGLKLKASSF